MLFNTVREDVKICGYTFHKITENNLKQLVEFVYKLDVSDVTFGSFIPTYLQTSEYKNDYLYKFIDNYLCIFEYHNKKMLLSTEPIGCSDNDKLLSVIKKCVKLLDIINGNKFVVSYYCFTDKTKSMFSNKVKTKNFCEEFVYKTSDLKNLVGKHYKSIRHSINSFEKNDFIFREYEDSDFENVKQLYELWSADYSKKQKENSGYGEKSGVNDKQIFFQYLKYRELCGVTVYVCYLENRLVGVIGIARLCKNSSIILFEKCDNTIKDITEYMWIRTLREYSEYEYEYDGDGGSKNQKGEHVSGLFAYKMRFRPAFLKELYICDIRKRNEKIYNSYFERV